MDRYKIFIAASLAFMTIGCTSGLIENPGVQEPQPGAEISDKGTIPGMMTVKVTDELAGRLLSYADESGRLSPEAAGEISIPGIEITGISTAFRIGGKFEARQRAAGLHRWFTVQYDENTPLSKAAGAAASASGIEMTEPVRRIKPMSVEMNDPYYPYQWHYYNTGLDGFTPGVDIKLQEAWDTYQVFGSDNVVVAVVDQGVDYAHEDLAGNMWVNQAEKDGEEGVDDDGNGYVDDIYGYNFVCPTGAIHPEFHGTHVAGTVAAVNNNGVGVCGVAGGRYPERGAQIMGVQIMDTRYDYSADVRQAFQYAAENGAVIVQNSWSYEVSPSAMPEIDKVAIDYFIDNAGMDENGSQTGPMKGGLAVFAAGNSAQTVSFPAAYERALAVAAVGPTGRFAYYTNYGDWVDICAPGGDISIDSDYSGVMSTFTSNTYGTDQGTSMACPHVSGVAALVLSTKTPEDGFTSDNLFKLLVNTADPSIYEYNPDRIGMLGSGIVDALSALAASLGCPQASPVTDFSAEAAGNSIVFTADVPEDAEGTPASYIYVYYSTSSFSASEMSGVERVEFKVRDLDDTADGRKTFVLEGLDFNTRYWYALAAANIVGDPSSLSSVESIMTVENRAPVIKCDTEGDIVLRASGTETRIYKVSDPDGQKVTVSWNNGGRRAVSFEELSDTEIQLTIDAVKSDPGDFTCSISAKDEYGLETTLEIPYTVLENSVPKYVPVEDICIAGPAQSVLFNPYDLFVDGDNDVLDFKYSLANSSIVSYKTTEDGLIQFTALKAGNVRIAVTATDPKGASATGAVTVIVRDSDSQMDVYPNPAQDHVNVRTAASGMYDVRITSDSGNTVYSGSAAISLSQPLRIDLADVAPGQYYITLEDREGNTCSGTFVKI